MTGLKDNTSSFNVVRGNAFHLPLSRLLKELPKDYIGTLGTISARHGPLVHLRLWGGLLNFAFISDAAVNRELYVRHTDALAKSPSQIQTFLYAAGPSVATAHGDAWRAKRKEANSLFSRQIVEASFAGQVAVVSNFAKSIPHSPQDAVRMARILAALTSSRGILGREITLTEAETQIAFSQEAAERFNAESAHLFARPNWMLAPWRRSLSKRRSEAFAIVQAAIEELRGAHEVNDGLMAHYVNGDFVTSSDTEMQTILVGLLMGAQDNIAAAAAWVLAFVARNPQLQQEIRAEIQNADAGELELQRFPLLHATVAEVLRLRPPAPANQPRKLRQPVEIANHILPKGTFVFNSFYNMHRDSDIYERPEAFEPARFLNGALHRSVGFAPFGHGPRNCVAQGMALQQLAAILIGLLRDRQISLLQEDLPGMRQRPFLTPAPFQISVKTV